MDSVSSHNYTTDNFKRILFPLLQSAALETVLLAQKSLLSVLFMISERNYVGTISDLIGTDKRFPFAELKRVEKPADENKDAGDSEEEDDDDDGDDDQDDDDASGEEGSDDDNEEEDSDGEVNGNGEGSEDDDEDDDNEDDDDEEDEDEDDDDDDEDEEEETQPPSKRKK